MLNIIVQSLNIKLPEEDMPYIRIVPKGNKPNYKLMRYIIQLIKLNPDHWDQKQWRCNTSFCFAGFVDFLAACQKDPKNVEDWLLYLNHDGTSECTTLITTNYYRRIWKNHTDRGFMYLDSAASLFLGINEEAEKCLFKSTNSIKELEEVVEDIMRDKFYWRT